MTAKIEDMQRESQLSVLHKFSVADSAPAPYSGCPASQIRQILIVAVARAWETGLWLNSNVRWLNFNKTPTKQNSFSQQPTVRGSPEIDSQSVRLGPQDPVHVQGVGSGPDKVIEDSGDGDMGTFEQYFEAEPNITKLSRHAKS